MCVSGERPSKVYHVKLDGCKHNLPQRVAYDDNGVVRWGYESENLVREGRVYPDNIIRSIKMYLYGAYRSTMAGQIIRRKLEQMQKHDY